MEYYYHLHRNPELSYQETETAAFVAERLKTFVPDGIRTGVGGNGVVAVLKGGKPGPVIAMRADMDALSIDEATGADFKSTKPGVMHACGHDAHTAMLMGVARVLRDMKDDLPGTVKFVFQPSEEMTPRGGALGMIEDGALENPRVDAMIGMHVWPMFETGKIGTQDGVVSAASDHLKVRIVGKSAHASMPHEGVDAIVASAAVIGAFQTIISREIDPKETAVVTIGTIRGGERYNIIPEVVDLDGTVRTFNNDVTIRMPGLIERAAKNTAAAYGCAAEIDYQSGYPSVVNAPSVARVCRDAIAETLGENGLLPPQGVPASGEDFSFFAKAVPAAFTWLGCRPRGTAEADAPPLHSAKFLPDPEALHIGVRYAAYAAFKLLSEFKPEKK
jgi:amidohydrolase